MSGNRPHVPVLLEEAVAALAIKPDGLYIDGTFGRGGHSRRMLASLGPQGRLIAFDRDPEAIAAAAMGMDDARFCIVHAPFSEMRERLEERGVTAVDGILLDIGVSSPQLDDPERGFSFRFDGPLDMRMDPTRGESAADWLNRAAEAEIREVVGDYGEERFAKQIARAITAARQAEPIVTTRQLAEIVGQAVRTREPGQDPATRTFQALRIHVNRELQELPLALAAAVRLLKTGGRLAVISFHSLEDRVVKQFIAQHAKPEAADPRLARLPLPAAALPQPTLNAIGKPIRPSGAETLANPRARSAILRIAERTAAPLAAAGTAQAYGRG